MDAIRVMVVDDEESVVDVLRALIGSDPRLRLVGSAHDAEAGIALALEERPDVVLMDVRMPGGGGLRAVREITRRYPEANVVALSAHEDEDSRIRMIGAGARDYVPKSESTDAILEAIHRSVRGGRGRRRRHHLRASEERREEQRSRVERALESGSITASFQAVVDLESGEVVGVEAQPQVAVLPSRPFDAWAGDAEAVGLLAKLEITALRAALASLPALPDDAFVEVEVSPETAAFSRFRRAVRDAFAHRLVLTISDLSAPRGTLATALEPLRERGVRFCLSDVGAGLAGLEHVPALWPEFVRLDRAITDDVHRDPTRHAVVAAAAGWAAKAGAAVIAEGVASIEQIDELGRLGVGLAQGDAVSPPWHLADLTAHGVSPVAPGRRNQHDGVTGAEPDPETPGTTERVT
jgi:DNA-binding NarL/FixJ family response regulator